MSGIGNRDKQRVFSSAITGMYPLVRDAVYGCQIWTGDLDRDGYAVIGRRMAHRVIWTSRFGPIPELHVLDHLCRRRACVNVADHLEAVTQSENERRKSYRYRLRRKSCKHGHDLTLHAMITPEGGRVCRACVKAGP